MIIPYPLENVVTLEPENKPAFQVIEPIIITQDDAFALRAYAESGADPYYYEMAAIAFDSLDMLLAAERMRERAKHYEVK
jgi:hypothetical protein